MTSRFSLGKGMGKVSSCGWGDDCNHCNHSKRHNSNHLSVHQWIRSAIRDSQQPTSPIGFQFWNFSHSLICIRIYIYITHIHTYIYIYKYIYIYTNMAQSSTAQRQSRAEWSNQLPGCLDSPQLPGTAQPNPKLLGPPLREIPVTVLWYPLVNQHSFVENHNFNR